MAGRLIISLDCEGKWGSCDRITPQLEADFTDEKILDAYKKILTILDDYKIKATFAFVGAFSLGFEDFIANKSYFYNVGKNVKTYLTKFYQDMEKERLEGWFGKRAYELVAGKTQHEIASHGFTHVPLCEKVITKAEFLNEMTMIRNLASPQLAAAKTFIYPRNLVGYTKELKSFDFIGYRDRLYPHSGFYTRFKSLASEINVFSPSQQLSDHLAQPHFKIPSGYFLNWRAGIRKSVPITLTTKRWENIIKHAIRTEGIAHLWSHPHNFITGHNMLPLFKEILTIAKQYIDKGDLINQTQKEFCLNF